MPRIVTGNHVKRTVYRIRDAGAAGDLGVGRKILSDSIESGVPCADREAPLANACIVKAGASRILARRQIDAVSSGNAATILEREIGMLEPPVESSIPLGKNAFRVKRLQSAGNTE